MTSTIGVPIVDRVQVFVHDDLNRITTYVLIEQGDWFEDEIKFLRHALQAGQKVIDIGANHGVYTLSMARSVGAAGFVWAFEPASATAALLEQSISGNRFTHVHLERSALSNRSGTAQLALNAQSELNELVRGGAAATSATETVPLATLDECMERFGWRDIDFVKLDAEGEEAHILEGGARFLAENAPLVMYELRAGSDLHLELVDAFATAGYATYRLVPGLDMLVPFDPEGLIDDYQLNLFACKPERAAAWAARGLLVSGTATDPWAGVADRSPYHWSRTLSLLPYGRVLAGHWAAAPPSTGRLEVMEALALHALSQDRSRSAAQRFAALGASLAILKTLCRDGAAHLRLATLARVADEFGERKLAQSALGLLAQSFLQIASVDPIEPFLAPLERFDVVEPGPAIGSWVLAAVLEAQECRGTWSSFFSGTAARPRLEAIRELGFGGGAMRRRLEMLEGRFGKVAGTGSGT